MPALRGAYEYPPSLAHVCAVWGKRHTLSGNSRTHTTLWSTSHTTRRTLTDFVEIPFRTVLAVLSNSASVTCDPHTRRRDGGHWSDPSRPVPTRLGSARLGSARLGSARLGSARLGSVRFGSVRFGSVRFGSARLGSARLGSARLGSARLGSARLGLARLGSARLGSG